MTDEPLQKLLVDILTRVRDGGMEFGWDYDIDYDVEAIKQVLEKHGYYRGFDTSLVKTPQQFYERFVNELEKIDPMSNISAADYDSILSAAKKASQIE